MLVERQDDVGAEDLYLDQLMTNWRQIQQQQQQQQQLKYKQQQQQQQQQQQVVVHEGHVFAYKPSQARYFDPTAEEDREEPAALSTPPPPPPPILLPEVKDPVFKKKNVVE